MDVEELPMHKDTYFFGYGIDIENPDKMARQVIELKEENQELKNSLERYQKELNEENLLCSKYAIEINDLKEKLEQCSAVAETNSELADSIDEYYKRRQKEFIEWLKQNIENEEYCYLSQNPSERCRKDVFEEVLSKYKEIIGGSDANISGR